MKQRSILWQAAGFAFVTFGGTILHFLYDWTGGSILFAPFSGVNESTWEHMKLLFWPMFLFALVQRLFFKDQENYWCVKLAEILLGLMLIPVLFYTYTGVWGQMRDWANIAVFFLAALGAFLLDCSLLRRNRLSSPWQQVLGLVMLWALAFCFVWCTFRPFHIALWRDPLTGTYGI